MLVDVDSRVIDYLTVELEQIKSRMQDFEYLQQNGKIDIPNALNEINERINKIDSKFKELTQFKG